MEIRPEIHALLDTIERYANRKFMHRPDVASLLEIAQRCHLGQLFDDILFHAKFLVNASQVLSRSGTESEETGPLSREFAAIMEKEFSLLQAAVNEAPDEVRTHFNETYFGMSHAGMTNLMDLFRDLAWLKNYSLDGQGAGERAGDRGNNGDDSRKGLG